MAFLINANASTPQPHAVEHTTAKLVAHNSERFPVYQGYPEVRARYMVLTYAQLAWLWSLWQTTAGSVTITYDDPAGTGSIVRYAYWHEPTWGARETMFYHDVVLQFTRVRVSA